MLWIPLVLLYGVLKGVREIIKKKALERNSTIEVLFMYTLLSFIMVLPETKAAMGMETKFYFYVALKSFVIFLAWMFSFRAIRKMPISLYGVLDLSRVLFATLRGGEAVALREQGVIFFARNIQKRYDISLCETFFSWYTYIRREKLYIYNHTL